MSNRPETGPMQFGEDWPGVFIRGDNACWYPLVLKSFLDAHPSKEGDNFQDGYYRRQLEDLRGLLHSCLLNFSIPGIARPDLAIQVLKEFSETLGSCDGD